jgi:hypothetical protein
MPIEEEEEELDYDTRGIKRFENISKNRGKMGYNPRAWRGKVGNSLSMAISRPSSNPYVKSRIVEQQINKDNKLYKTVDHHFVNSTEEFYRKSSIQTIVPYYFTPCKMNQQIVNYTQNIKLNKKQNKKQNNNELNSKLKKSQSNFVCVDQIDERLWIGNRESVTYNIIHDKYPSFRWTTHIIDLSTQGCFIPKNKNVIMHRIEFNDTRNISHKSFSCIINKVIDIIDSVPSQYKIIIVCDAGVNRSVCAAIAYAIIRCNMTFDSALRAIENAKNCDQWFNLTNIRLLRLLKNLKI